MSEPRFLPRDFAFFADPSATMAETPTLAVTTAEIMQGGKEKHFPLSTGMRLSKAGNLRPPRVG